MASITKVGERFRAQVRRKGHKSIAQTFDTEPEARAWAESVERGIERGEVKRHTVGSLIAEFRRMRAKLGRPVAQDTNTHYMLAHLDEDLGHEAVDDLTPDRLAEWASMRRQQGAGGYTVNMELSQLSTVLRHTASWLRITLPDVVGSARPLLHYGQLITGGTKRARRPSEDEQARLLDWLGERNPIIRDAVAVAAITGMRRGELARIQWADIDQKARAVIVRKRKHPRRVEARDEPVPLLGEAWAIVQRQPKTDARIFPVSREALTDAVTAGVRALSIPDLRLHDFRRAATSRLRELGFDADARKAVVGHRSDEVHERYVAVSLEELHARYDAAAQDTQRGRQRRKTTADHRDEAKRTPRERGGS